jgi:hypothetical protein
MCPATAGTGRKGSPGPFERLGGTGNTAGVGLGLAVARGLTEAMGGALRPEETPGGGLTMAVSLPAAPSQASWRVCGSRDSRSSMSAVPNSRG